MSFDQADQSDKLRLHYVDFDMRGRAAFANISWKSGHSCEVYESLGELFTHTPRSGVLLIREDDQPGASFSEICEQLQKMGIWLGVIAVGVNPKPAQIVEAVKAGALDYFALPIDPANLTRRLARLSTELENVSERARRRIEAQKMIERLSTREAEVLELLSAGHGNKLIGRILGISPRTVEIHRANMMHKLGASHAACALRIKMESEQFMYA